MGIAFFNGGRVMESKVLKINMRRVSKTLWVLVAIGVGSMVFMALVPAFESVFMVVTGLAIVGFFFVGYVVLCMFGERCRGLLQGGISSWEKTLNTPKHHCSHCDSIISQRAIICPHCRMETALSPKPNEK
jgi:hypothetical protein